MAGHVPDTKAPPAGPSLLHRPYHIPPARLVVRSIIVRRWPHEKHPGFFLHHLTAPFWCSSGSPWPSEPHRYGHSRCTAPIHLQILKRTMKCLISTLGSWCRGLRYNRSLHSLVRHRWRFPDSGRRQRSRKRRPRRVRIVETVRIQGPIAFSCPVDEDVSSGRLSESQMFHKRRNDPVWMHVSGNGVPCPIKPGFAISTASQLP